MKHKGSVNMRLPAVKPVSTKDEQAVKASSVTVVTRDGDHR